MEQGYHFVTSPTPKSTVMLRRALEALRNGVPNQDAVRGLDPGQLPAIKRFTKQLDQVTELFSAGSQSKGLLLSGGFGSGKSHLLQHFEHLALKQNFVCSRIVIGKETPLYDPAKVYRAAVEAAVLPDGTSGQAIQEIAQRLDTKGPAYADFYHWVGLPNSGLAQLFAASLKVHERAAPDPDITGAITDFWSGDALKLTDLKKWLRELGLPAAFVVTSVAAKELALQRFHFATHLFKAAGYRGWVLLIDEVEMIGKYGVVSRGKSYGELARWLGEVSSEQYPGITAVASLTDTYASQLLTERQDKDLVPQKLEGKGTDEARSQARRAETGMRIIEHDFLSLEKPDEARLLETYQQLRKFHADAYGWNPPELDFGTSQESLRLHVRKWIHEWDLRRLFPGITVDTQVTKVIINMSQDRDLGV